MKFCERPWTMMYLINAEEGEVWPCSWLDSSMNLGNILEQNVDELLQSKNLKKLRGSILDGSFRYCDSHKCAFIANDSLPDLDKEEIAKITQTPYPHQFNIAYDETCNHACPSCRKDFFKPSEDYYKNVEMINEKMLPYYNKATYISVNGRGDIFACEHLLSMLEKLTPENDDLQFVIETNAVLFDKKHWKRISHMGKYHINVVATVNSFHESTYRYLNGYANHVDKVINNLRFISSLRKQDIINEFWIAMVVQESNFRELPEYIERCLDEFNVDKVELRGIMQFSIPENEFWFKDVFNPAHPFYKEALDILHHPIMEDPRVWFWEGDYERVRMPKEIPMKRFEQYYNVLWKMCLLDDKGELKKIFLNYKDRKFAVYGAGHLTEYVVRKMVKLGIVPCCIFDKNVCGKCIEGIKVYQISEDTEIDLDIEVIINTLSFYQEEVKKHFLNIGVKTKIVTLDEIISEKI